MTALPVVQAGCVAAVVTVAVLPAVRRGLRRLTRPDVPNERSSHAVATVRGGGAACLIGVLAGWIVGVPSTSVLVGAGVTIVLFAVVGFTDDIRPFSARARLVAQVGAGLSSLVWSTAIQPAGLVGVGFCMATVVVLVGYTNAFNFMDGINGISGLHAVVCGGFAAYVAWRHDAIGVAAFAVALAAAGAAFLPFNLRQTPLLFLGDVGSYLFGAGLASVAVLAWRAGATFEAACGSLVIYLADTGSTVMRRLLRGDDVFSAHREHVYQQLTPRGAAHGPVAVGVAVASAVVGLLGVATDDASLVTRLVLDVAMLAVAVFYLAAPRWSSRQMSVGQARS